MSESTKRLGVAIIGACTIVAAGLLLWTSLAAPAGRGGLFALVALLVVPPAALAGLNAAGCADRA